MKQKQNALRDFAKNPLGKSVAIRVHHACASFAKLLVYFSDLMCVTLIALTRVIANGIASIYQLDLNQGCKVYESVWVCGKWIGCSEVQGKFGEDNK
nr:hypothetical protein [Tanacetum cinerariifolium]